MDAVILKRITKTKGVCGGRACIVGHRIRVMDVVVLHDQRGLSPEEIVDQYPGIRLADVHAALAYYVDNREEIQADFGKDQEWAESAAASDSSLIKEKLGG